MLLLGYGILLLEEIVQPNSFLGFGEFFGF